MQPINSSSVYVIELVEPRLRYHTLKHINKMYEHLVKSQSTVLESTLHLHTSSHLILYITAKYNGYESSHCHHKRATSCSSTFLSAIRMASIVHCRFGVHAHILTNTHTKRHLYRRIIHNYFTHQINSYN